MEKSLKDVVDEDTMREIDALDGEEKERFDELFMENLYDRGWFKDNNEDYANPNVEKVKEKTYEGMVRYGLLKRAGS